MGTGRFTRVESVANGAALCRVGIEQDVEVLIDHFLRDVATVLLTYGITDVYIEATPEGDLLHSIVFEDGERVYARDVPETLARFVETLEPMLHIVRSLALRREGVEHEIDGRRYRCREYELAPRLPPRYVDGYRFTKQTHEELRRGKLTVHILYPT